VSRSGRPKREQPSARHVASPSSHPDADFPGKRRRAAQDEGKPRAIRLAGEHVDYRLIRVRRSTIGMQIDLSGLTVRASRWVSVREIEEALTERATWIVRTLAEWKSRRRDVLPSQWKNGARILFRGRELALCLHAAPTISVAADLFHLTIRHPSPDDEPAIARSVGHWLKDEALATVAPRVAEYAARLRRSPRTVLSNARSEWGSCTHEGVIRLNWRLVQLPPQLADYVVAHEVAHLVELNHGARFWALVETLFPGHKHARRALGDWTALLEA
jgi:predicted metal-dependent hydrolase